MLDEDTKEEELDELETLEEELKEETEELLELLELEVMVTGLTFAAGLLETDPPPPLQPKKRVLDIAAIIACAKKPLTNPIQSKFYKITQ